MGLSTPICWGKSTPERYAKSETMTVHMPREELSQSNPLLHTVPVTPFIRELV